VVGTILSKLLSDNFPPIIPKEYHSGKKNGQLPLLIDFERKNARETDENDEWEITYEVDEITKL
jgi:hypothetical protein